MRWLRAAGRGAPVYGSRLTLGFVRRRLQERGVDRRPARCCAGQPVEIGPSASIHPRRPQRARQPGPGHRDPAGVVMASGDFKMDPSAPAEERTTWRPSPPWGDRGVLALLSDSTNVEQRGHTGGEDDLPPAFEQVLARTRGRVLVPLRHRHPPHAAGGRRRPRPRAQGGLRGPATWWTTPVAHDLGLLRLPEGTQLSAADAGRRAPGASCPVRLGQPGRAALRASMVSVDEHPSLPSGPGTRWCSPRAPSPATSAWSRALIGNLFRRGADVVHPGWPACTCPGHCNREDLVELLRRVRPRYLSRARRVPHAGPARAPGRAGRAVRATGCRWPRTATCWPLGPPRARKRARAPAGPRPARPARRGGAGRRGDP